LHKQVDNTKGAINSFGISGNLTVKLSGSADWKIFNAGETFAVQANASFDVKVTVQTAYSDQ